MSDDQSSKPAPEYLADDEYPDMVEPAPGEMHEPPPYPARGLEFDQGVAYTD